MSRNKIRIDWICRKCGIEGEEKFYPSKKHICRKCWNSYTYGKKKDKIAEYMISRGGIKCQKCGYDRYRGALCFHHRDPTQKDPKWNRQWAAEKLYKELDKCDILCMNCHAEAHAQDII
jgi:hypothetical protein